VLAWGDVFELESHAFPGPDDEIAVAFTGDNGAVEVLVGPEGVRRILGEDEDETEHVSTLEGLYLRLAELVTGPQWHSLASSTYSTLSPTLAGSPVLFSSTLVDETATRKNL
jgi:hypothetical protein